jgi:hypothetical protein
MIIGQPHFARTRKRRMNATNIQNTKPISGVNNSIVDLFWD